MVYTGVTGFVRLLCVVRNARAISKTRERPRHNTILHAQHPKDRQTHLTYLSLYLLVSISHQHTQLRLTTHPASLAAAAATAKAPLFNTPTHHMASIKSHLVITAAAGTQQRSLSPPLCGAKPSRRVPNSSTKRVRPAQLLVDGFAKAWVQRLLKEVRATSTTAKQQ